MSTIFPKGEVTQHCEQVSGSQAGRKNFMGRDRIFFSLSCQAFQPSTLLPVLLPASCKDDTFWYKENRRSLITRNTRL